jgi:hypothetical protein
MLRKFLSESFGGSAAIIILAPAIRCNQVSDTE